jgi:rod shape-determining protein MreD
MSFFFFSVLLAVLGLAQVSFASRVGLFGVTPDLFSALTVIAAVLLSPWQAVSAGLLAGLFKDSFDVHAFGMNTILLPLLALAFSRLNRRLSLDNELLCAILGGAAVFACTLVGGMVLVFSGRPVPSGALASRGLLAAVLTGLVIFPLFRSIKSAHR